MNKHTQGPWRAKQEYANRWRIEQDTPSDATPFSVALVTTTVLEMGSDNGTAPANACLIAAAPTLLMALEFLLEKADSFNVAGTYFDQFRENRDALDTARDAIFKATGSAA